MSISLGQSFGGVLAYRLAALFATYFANYYTAWEALIVTLPGGVGDDCRVIPGRRYLCTQMSAPRPRCPFYKFAASNAGERL